jgi:hypothetical protein
MANALWAEAQRRGSGGKRRASGGIGKGLSEGGQTLLAIRLWQAVRTLSVSEESARAEPRRREDCLGDGAEAGGERLAC